MSAKEFYSRPSIHIEILPDELLCEVLRHATWVPYGIDPSDLVLKRLQSLREVELHKEYRRSLVTKRYLIRVCKRWYRLAFLYLYEWVLVSRVKNMEGIVKAVERPLFDDSEQGSVGQFTKRVDIDFRWTGRERPEELQQTNHLLPCLLQHLTELRVMVVGQIFEAVWMDPLISHQLCPKLEYLTWTIRPNQPKVPTNEHWIDFFQSHPNLVGVNIPERINLNQRTPLAEFRHSRILSWTSTIVLGRIIIPSAFPSLKRLNIIVSQHQSLVLVRWESMIRQPLPSLETLQWNLYYDTAEYAPDTTLDITQRVHPFMPNLRCVELVLLEWTVPRTWSRYTPPASISVLGIRVRSTQPRKRVIKNMLKVLHDIVRNAPRLTIQFIDEGTFKTIVKEKEYLARCARVGEILDRWLDHEGQEYRLPLELAPIGMHHR